MFKREHEGAVRHTFTGRERGKDQGAMRFASSANGAAMGLVDAGDGFQKKRGPLRKQPFDYWLEKIYRG